MDIIVDIQFCKDIQDRVVPKEVATASVRENFLAHWIIAPPYPVQKLNCVSRQQNNWLYRHKHGIAWQDGDISQTKLTKNLQAILLNVEKIYVRGKDKALFLQDFTTNEIINLEDDENCPSFHNLTWLNTYCIYHAIKNCHQTLSCALNNVAKIRYWLAKTRDCRDEQFGDSSGVDASA